MAPHFYQVDYIEKAAAGVARSEFSILISYIPEIHAARAGLDALISGPAHGGQVCLPGAVLSRLIRVLQRRMGSSLKMGPSVRQSRSARMSHLLS